MTDRADVAKAMDLVTWDLSCGDAEVLAALSCKAPLPSTDSLHRGAAPSAAVSQSDSQTTSLVVECKHLRASWEAVLHGGMPPHTPPSDVSVLCASTEQCLSAAIAIDAGETSAMDGTPTFSSLSACVDSVLSPLLDHLSEKSAEAARLVPHVALSASRSSSTEPVESSHWGCYVSVLCTVLPPLSSAIADRRRDQTAVSSMHHDDGCTGDSSPTCASLMSEVYTAGGVPVVNRLLGPLIIATVEPLEKALSFHFAPGQKTASLDSPQHFFSFVASQLTELSSRVSHKTSLRADNGVDIDDNLLTCVVQGCFLRSCRAVFVDCYRWRTDSVCVGHVDYCVTVVNAIIDFATAADALADVRVLADCFVTPLLLPCALDTHFQEAVRCAALALEQGAAVLWRRRFLTRDRSLSAPGARVSETHEKLRCGTTHFIRCVDAYVSRLMRDLAPATSSVVSLAARLWECVVAPVTLIFSRTVHTHVDQKPEGVSGSSSAMLRLECLCTALGCCDEVLAMMERWMSVLGVVGDNNDAMHRELSTESLDDLTLFRETTLRECVTLLRDLAEEMVATTDAPTEGSARLVAFHRLDSTLAVVQTTIDAHTYGVILDVLGDALRRPLSTSTQSDLRAHLDKSGWPRVASLFAPAMCQEV